MVNGYAGSALMVRCIGSPASNFWTSIAKPVIAGKPIQSERSIRGLDAVCPCGEPGDDLFCSRLAGCKKLGFATCDITTRCR